MSREYKKARRYQLWVTAYKTKTNPNATAPLRKKTLDMLCLSWNAMSAQARGVWVRTAGTPKDIVQMGWSPLDVTGADMQPNLRYASYFGGDSVYAC